VDAPVELVRAITLEQQVVDGGEVVLVQPEAGVHPQDADLLVEGLLEEMILVLEASLISLP
jgi:hypothetical protein